MRNLSIIIPAYNEADRLTPTLNDITVYLSLLDSDSEIILVNDGSQDATEQVIRKYMNNLDDMLRFKTQIIYIPLKQNLGKGAALKRGLTEAQGEYVLYTDADNSTSIRELQKLIPFMNNNFDIVIGSRSIAGSNIVQRQNLLRQSMGKIFNFLVRMFVMKDFIDTQCGFKLFRLAALKKILPHTKITGFAFDVELLYLAKKSKFKIIEVPITWNNHPKSHVHLLSSSLRMLKDLMKIKSLHKKTPV
ncbi:MAG: glycosyltransferase [Elusimicrobia bacterium]|nr:glycosyltransferase [Elusimicrobiota bacterium]